MAEYIKSVGGKHYVAKKGKNKFGVAEKIIGVFSSLSDAEWLLNARKKKSKRKVRAL